MSEYFMGQIMMAGYQFAPKNFASCSGQLMPVQQNQALFSLLGITYGGDGRVTFGLPDLRSRVPVGSGPSADGNWQPSPMSQGQMGGTENVTLLPQQLPVHTHYLTGTSAAGTTRNPTNQVIGTANAPLYGDASSRQVPLNPATCGQAGGTAPHPNLQPYTTINFCIALTGIFPTRS